MTFGVKSAVFFSLIFVVSAAAQPNRAASSQDARFPYTFSNFVWWSDAALRLELKRSIPNLPPEIARDSQYEARIRTVLKQLLRRRGIQADVQSIDPSPELFTMGRDPDAPPVAIAFSILSPPTIVVEKLVMHDPPQETLQVLDEQDRQLQGRPYRVEGFWFSEKQIKEALREKGYLSATVAMEPGQPKKDGERYLVPVSVSIATGMKYHVSTIDTDGGPLLAGRDLSAYYSLRPGDIATKDPFGRLMGSLRSVYWHAGYADVAIDGAPILDSSHALASYHLKVTPGPMYRVRSIKMEGLTPQQEEAARRAIGLKSGDVYDELALVSVPDIQGLGFSYSQLEDKQNHVVDLTLSFFKK